MASISRQGNGRIVIQFRAVDGKRKSIRLGQVDEATALDAKQHVENLVLSLKKKQPPCKATEDYVSSLLSDPALTFIYDRMAAAGLVAMRKPVAEKKHAKRARLMTLAGFVDDYIGRRRDVKPNTSEIWGQTRKNLFEYFGRNRALAEITPGECDDFRQWLLSEANEQTQGGLAEATASRRIRCARQFLKAAVRHHIIEENPFQEVTTGQEANQERFHFVKREDIDKAIEAAPDAEWRVIIALARYGGLRIPSELLPLTWEHINWDTGRMTVTAPKTKKVGKPYRVVPIFPEVRQHLEELYEQAPRGTTHVITRYRQKNANLRTQFLRILRRAGVEPWEKLFQNCRSTRETELADEYPIQTVVAWIGNTPGIAMNHYLQVRDEHFEHAIAGPEKAVQKSGAKAVQKSSAAGNYGPNANECTGRGSRGKTRGETPFFAGFNHASRHAQQDSNLRPAD